MTEPLGTVDTPLGRTPVAHRLAVAVWPVDAVTRRPAPPSVRVGRETARSLARPAPHRGTLPDPQRLAVRVAVGAGTHVVVHDRSVPRGAPAGAPPGTPPEIVVRITDPDGRFVPRRVRVPIWSLDEVRGVDDDPSAGPAVPALSRTVRPWLLPGAAYPFPGGSTGARLRVVRGGTPVRWPRVEVFGGGGARLGWGHGDEHGQVLVVVDSLGSGMPSGPVPVALRVHVPTVAPPGPPSADAAADPLRDLLPETLPRQPTTPGAFTDDTTIGVAVPSGYVTASADVVRSLVPGRVTALADIPFVP